MEVTRVQPDVRETRAVSQSTESQTITSIEASRQKKDKQSLDYILRTGLAGGLAGCVVRLYLYASGFLLVFSVQITQLTLSFL